MSKRLIYKLLFITIFLTKTAFADSVYVPSLTLKDEGTSQGSGIEAIDCVGGGIACTASGITGTITVASPAPTDATYITQTANGTLSAEQALSSLSTGIMRVATTTGVITSLTDSSGIAANISDETGSGALVFGTSPVFTTPNIGSATGSVSGNAGTVTIADAASDTTTFPLLGTSATGTLAPATDAGLSYNALTDTLTATAFSGPLTGNVTGNVSGTAATVTDATQAAITSAANLATVGTITSGVWNAGAVTSSGAVEGTSMQIDTNSTGVSLDTDGDGMLIMAGTGNGNDEDLRWNLDDGVDGANTIEVTSGTSANQITFTSIDLKVPTEAYDATNWNGDNTVPTKDAVRDKIESLGGSGTALAIVPRPWYGGTTNYVSAGTTITTNTSMRVGLVSIPYAITVNKITIDVVTNNVNGTYKLALFSEDGGTKLFEVTTATVTGTSVVTTAVASVAVSAGQYYIAILPVSTASADIAVFATSAAEHGSFRSLASEPTFEGTVTVTADTVPSTITPGSITAVTTQTLVARLDN